MSLTPEQLIETAIARNLACVLNVPTAGASYPHRSRLLGRDASGIWVDADEIDSAALSELISSRVPMGVSVRIDSTELVFASPLLKADAKYRLNESTAAPALLLATPTQIIPKQRRKQYRVSVRPDDEVIVRVWKINEYVLVKDKVMASQELKVELKDLSMGGMRCKVSARGEEALRLVANQRLRVEIRYPGQPDLVIEGRIRHPIATQRDDAVATIGISFEHMDRDLEARRGQSQLTKCIAELERSAARRVRRKSA